MLHIYNTFTKQKELFKPIHDPKVNMYVCGITVYDYCHIGHARTVLAFDVIYRYLLVKGYQVNYVRNITDIDDKIIKRAHENNENIQALVTRFTTAMHDDFKALGALSPSQEPCATQNIKEMITLIEKLIENGLAYVATNHDVYYHVRKFQSYGQLSHRHLEDLCVGARVEMNEDKQDPLDFVLWKAAKQGEPSWESPWGNGRPGWHIECSAMANRFLGDTLDIHGGGYDLIFPHHENERAQSEGAHHEKFVNIWMHTGFVEVHEEKMSKSLGNFFTIRDVLKDYDAQTIRYFLVSSHYRSPVNYSEDNLQQARTCCERLYLSLLDRNIDDVVLDEHNSFVQRFYQAMDDDFNTPLAVSVLCELSKEINIAREHNPKDADVLASLLKKLANILGLLTQDAQTYLQASKNTNIYPEQIERLVKERDQARLDKDFAKADTIRKQLTDMGIILEDSPQGTRWRV